MWSTNWRAQPASRLEPRGKIRWAAGVPRWVKVFVITALGLALLLAVVMLVRDRPLACLASVTGLVLSVGTP